MFPKRWWTKSRAKDKAIMELKKSLLNMASMETSNFPRLRKKKISKLHNFLEKINCFCHLLGCRFQKWSSKLCCFDFTLVTRRWLVVLMVNWFCLFFKGRGNFEKLYMEGIDLKFNFSNGAPKKNFLIFCRIAPGCERAWSWSCCSG